MKIFDFLLGHQDVINKFNEGVGQVKASMDGKQKDLDKSGEGYFFKSWQQEFWGAKTLSECELQEFQFKCEAVRMFLELITDENGYLVSGRRQILLDYVQSMGLEIGIGADLSGTRNFQKDFLADHLNVLEMDGIADFTFMVYTYGARGGMVYTAEQRVRKSGEKKVVYMMKLVDFSDQFQDLYGDGLVIEFDNVNQKRSSAFKARQKEKRNKLVEERRAKEQAEYEAMLRAYEEAERRKNGTR